MVRIVKVHRGTGLPVGYGSLLPLPSPGEVDEVEGLKRDSTGAAYLTISYRPAKKSKGKVGVDIDVDVGGLEVDLGGLEGEEEGSSGSRVKWAILAEGFFCHS